MNIDTVKRELSRFMAEQVDPAARVVDLETADGHAGLSFLFALERGQAREHYVLRLPPAGVKRRGNTDVYRQAPLLRALHTAGLPVPAVPWARSDEAYFGLPFIIMERLPGNNLLIWDPAAVFERSPAAIQPLWLRAAETLAAFHRFDWRTHLADWEAPRPLSEEIPFWRAIYQQAPEAEWAAAGARVEALLLDSLPTDPPLGLTHGDYQPGNVMFDQHGRVTGVFDWELAHIGTPTLDLGWLMMMADPRMWHPDFRAVHPPTNDALQAAYEAGLGHSVARASWYQALAGYRFGAISCLNVKLHRKGQREDPLWEQMALAVPSLFGRAETILRTEWSG